MNQLNETASRNKLAKRSVAAGLGLTAVSLLAAQSADAATEIAQVAARLVPRSKLSVLQRQMHSSRQTLADKCDVAVQIAADGRIAAIAFLFAPVIGWVSAAETFTSHPAVKCCSFSSAHQKVTSI